MIGKHRLDLVDDNGSRSLWMDERLPAFPPLEKNLKADVCVVGAGIAGLTCAYTLAKKGKSVVVVDRAELGKGETARTTAHVSWVLDDRYDHLEKYFGEEGARFAAESHSSAIDYMERIIVEEKIACDWERVDGYLFVPRNSSQAILDDELKVLDKIGKKVNKLDKLPLESFASGPCLHFPKQAQVHVQKYLKGLIAAIQKYGGKIFCHTHINDIEEGTPCVVKSENGLKIAAKSVIVTTCTPINNRYMIHTKQAPYRTYVIAACVPKGFIAKGLYWDTEDPFHYIRLQPHASNPKFEWLIVGGEDHRTGQEKHIESKYTHLEKWAKKRFPMMKEIEYRWSGQVFETVDSLAFIGKNPGDKHIYISTGDCGNGITYGTIAGILIPDLISGKKNPWQKLYDPSRITLEAAATYIQENFNVAEQYCDWLTPGAKKKIDRIAPGEGVILREGLKKIAVYKDMQNTVHVNSAYCPHLGGCVRWNSCEKSWDCPCHGSRFNGCGKLLCGPSTADLYKP